MNKEEIRFKILQTLIKGNKVYIKDSKDKEHILGRGYCENLNLINHYMEQLDYDIIVCMIQENEESDLYIETIYKLKNLWEEEVENERN